MLFDSKWIYRIGVSSSDVADPIFVRLDDFSVRNHAITKNDTMAYPIHNKDGKLVACI